MASPKKQMKEARKSYKKEKKAAKKTFSQEKRQGVEVFKQRSKQAEQLFANNPERLQTVRQELRKQYQSEQQSFKTNRQKGFIKAKADFAEQVKSAPLGVLKSKEIKEHRLPDLKQERQDAKQAYKESKRAFYAAKREARQEAKEARRDTFNYGSRDRSETNFSNRKSNFTAYQSDKSKTKVNVRPSGSERAKQVFAKAKQEEFRFDRSYKVARRFTSGESNFHQSSAKPRQGSFKTQTKSSSFTASSRFQAREQKLAGFKAYQGRFKDYQTSKQETRVRVSVSETPIARRIFAKRESERVRLSRPSVQTAQVSKTQATFTEGTKRTLIKPSGTKTTTYQRFRFEKSSEPQGFTGVDSGSTTEQKGKTIRFKRQLKSDSLFSDLGGKKKTKSGRFFYESPKMKEKKAEKLIAKEKLKEAKSKHKQAKETYRFKKKSKINTALLLKEAGDLMSENEDFSGIRDIEHTVRNTKRYSKMTYKAGKMTTKGVIHTGRFAKNRAVNLTERTKNWRKGRGFVPNNKDRHMSQRIKRFVQKSGKNIVKGVKSMVAFVKNLPTIIMNVVANPIVWLWLGGILIFLSIIAMFLEVQMNSLIKQDDFELNKSYVHMTYEDAQHTLENDRGTTYYTKIDDVMAYMNYRYDDYELDKNTGLPLISQTYKEYLSELWEEMNGGDSLKSMATLYKDTKSIYFIDEDEQEDLEELKENGVYAALQELENPFQGQTDDDILTMTYRFGYYNNSGEVKMNNHIILEASEGQVIVAPTDGKIVIEDDDVIIVSHEGKTSETRLKLKNIADGSVSDGQRVLTGDVIGKTSSSAGLKIYYQKYNDDKEVQALEYVNPAFYFPKVVQAQSTILANIGQFQGDVMETAKFVYEFMKEKGASNQFIAGVLGNWFVESQITAKRAEGDYLNPPVGATDTSWDDDNWLNMGGQEIYNGRYPNIKHRGLGLGQWTDTYDGAVRNTLLRNYAKEKNAKWYDLELQLNFMFDGDSPYYTNWVKNNMANTGSPASMAQLFLIYWEGNAGDKLIERQTSAVEWYYQIEKGFVNTGTAQSDMAALESVRGDLYNNSVPGGGDGMGYAYGQCTWGTAARINQLGLKLKGRNGEKIPITSTMGNGQDWVATAAALGGETGSTPKEGAIISFVGGSHGSEAPWGHVGFVEKVYEDGSFLISETNVNGNPNYTFRKFTAADSNMSFAYTTK